MNKTSLALLDKEKTRWLDTYSSLKAYIQRLAAKEIQKKIKKKNEETLPKISQVLLAI